MYPVAYDQHPPERRNRVTIFFRILMVIPHFVVGFFGGIVMFFTLLASWFALLVTGRYPAGLYAFHAGALRWTSRVIGYLHLVVDAYPPFDLGEHPDYPIQVRVGPPLASYSRIKVLLRILLAIPVYIIAYVMQLWMYAVAIGLWFVGVVTGRTPFAEAQRIPMAYYTRANAFYWMLTEDFPPFDPGRGELPATAPPTSLPA